MKYQQQYSIIIFTYEQNRIKRDPTIVGFRSTKRRIRSAETVTEHVTDFGHYQTNSYTPSRTHETADKLHHRPNFRARNKKAKKKTNPSISYAHKSDKFTKRAPSNGQIDTSRFFTSRTYVHTFSARDSVEWIYGIMCTARDGYSYIIIYEKRVKTAARRPYKARTCEPNGQWEAIVSSGKRLRRDTIFRENFWKILC